jgi:hypothetical protein
MTRGTISALSPPKIILIRELKMAVIQDHRPFLPHERIGN